jgi:hypothetical protein
VESSEDEDQSYTGPAQQRRSRRKILKPPVHAANIPKPQRVPLQK